MKEILFGVIFIILILDCSCEDGQTNNKIKKFPSFPGEVNTEYWYDKGKKAIEKSLSKPQPITKKAKNVILFIGDGMSLITLTAARIYKRQTNSTYPGSGEESSLFFEKFPYNSLIKTYNVDRQVPDSAGTATAFLTGVKANFGTIGVNANIAQKETDCSKIAANSVPSILKWAQDQGKATGVVTTTRITHATPAASYAHTANRDWESDSDFPPDLKNGEACKDIARQLIEDDPGKRLRVILGGGFRSFYPKNFTDPRSGKTGTRLDDKNLVEEWKAMRKEEGRKFMFVNSTVGLRAALTDEVEYLFGLFNHSHMAFEAERDRTSDGEPSLTEMTLAAIEVLSRDPHGFVLLVEGGRIDHAHHSNLALMALDETVALDRAIYNATDSEPIKSNPDDTLIVVTADHAHTMTFNGYPERGQSIFGFADNDTDGVKYTTLMYGNGPGHSKDRTEPEDPSSLRNVYYSAVKMEDSNHGGEDVGLYSRGPFAHLFYGLQDQSFIAHAIGYAACIGNYNNSDHCPSGSSPAWMPKPQVFVLLSSFFIVLLLIKKSLNL